MHGLINLQITKIELIKQLCIDFQFSIQLLMLVINIVGVIAGTVGVIGAAIV